MRGKPFENVGVPEVLKVHICPSFKIYFLKLQSVFVGSIKIFVSKMKEGLASEPLIKTFLLNETKTIGWW